MTDITYGPPRGKDKDTLTQAADQSEITILKKQLAQLIEAGLEMRKAQESPFSTSGLLIATKRYFDSLIGFKE